MSDKKVTVRAIAMYANTVEPDPEYGKYGINCTQLSEAAVKALEDMGVEVRDGTKPNTAGTCYPEYGRYIKPSQKSNNFEKVFADGVKCADEIGNGSIVRVFLFASKMGKATTLTAKICKFLVDELVAYTPGAVEDADDAL